MKHTIASSDVTCANIPDVASYASRRKSGNWANLQVMLKAFWHIAPSMSLQLLTQKPHLTSCPAVMISGSVYSTWRTCVRQTDRQTDTQIYMQASGVRQAYYTA